VPSNETEGDQDKGFMDIGATFITDPQPTVLEEPRDGSLNHPAVDTQATAVCRPPPSQERADVPVTQLATVRLRIVGSITLNAIRAPARI
jgi:hypothetical protein